MSNVRYGNTFYIDTQYSTSSDELAVKNIRVKGIIFNSLSASARLLLSDNGNNKIDLRGSTIQGINYLDLSRVPVVFSNTIRPTTLTNATATLIIEETKA